MWTDEGEGKVLYVQTHGVTDPGRCATPFFLAASAAAMEVEVAIYFTMYGPTLLQKDVVDKIGPKGDVGQPLSYFIKQATDLGVERASGAGMPFVVEELLASPLGRAARGLHLRVGYESLDDLIDGVKMIGGAAFNDMAMRADAVVSF